MDANGDGKVDLNEFLAAGGTEEQFAQHDTDRSGWLENNEIEAARHQQLLWVREKAAALRNLDKMRQLTSPTAGAAAEEVQAPSFSLLSSFFIHSF